MYYCSSSQEGHDRPLYHYQCSLFAPLNIRVCELCKYRVMSARSSQTKTERKSKERKDRQNKNKTNKQTGKRQSHLTLSLSLSALSLSQNP